MLHIICCTLISAHFVLHNLSGTVCPTIFFLLVLSCLFCTTPFVLLILYCTFLAAYFFYHCLLHICWWLSLYDRLFLIVVFFYIFCSALFVLNYLHSINFVSSVYNLCLFCASCLHGMCFFFSLRTRDWEPKIQLHIQHFLTLHCIVRFCILLQYWTSFTACWHYKKDVWVPI